MRVSELFLKIFEMGLTGSLLIVAVMFFRLIMRKTPKWMICLLWGIVAIRLICPIPIPIQSPFGMVPAEGGITESILSELRSKSEPEREAEALKLEPERETEALKPEPEREMEASKSESEQEVEAGLQHGANTSLEAGTSEVLTEGNFEMPLYERGRNLQPYGGRKKRNATDILSAVWLCGVFGILLYGLIGDIRLRSGLKEGILLRENIYLCDHVRSPFVYGLIRPCIYLPPGIGESDMECVIAHEKAHIQRKDPVWKLAAFLLLSVYWFQPLCWIAFWLFCRDIEFACDEKVIRSLGASERKAYSESLLSCSFTKKSAIVYSLAFGEVGVKKRVKTILNYKKPTLAAVVLTIFGFLVIGVCFLTVSPREEQNRMISYVKLSPEERYRVEKEIEIHDMLLNYDKDQIVYVSVILPDLGTADACAQIFLVNREKEMDAVKQDQIRALVAGKLELDESRIDLLCIDEEDFLADDR